MSREYVVVVRNRWEDIQLYNFDEKELYNFLNEVQKLEGLTDDERDVSNSRYSDIESPVWIMGEFPAGIESNDDGSFCIANIWPTGGVFILKGNKVFIPKIVTHAKTVTVTEFVPAPTRKRTRKKSVKAPSKK